MWGDGVSAVPERVNPMEEFVGKEEYRNKVFSTYEQKILPRVREMDENSITILNNFYQ